MTLIAYLGRWQEARAHAAFRFWYTVKLPLEPGAKVVIVTSRWIPHPDEALP